MGIQATNAKLLYERRRAHIDGEAYDPTADDAKPAERDRWAVYTLLKAGQIESQHKDAAEWLWKLIDKGDALKGAAWVDECYAIGNGHEGRHARAMTIAWAKREAEAAFQALAHAGYGRYARALFEPVREHGRPSVALLAERLDMEANGCRRRLVETLEALSNYRDRIDKDRARHKARLDGTHFSEQEIAII